MLNPPFSLELTCIYLEESGSTINCHKTVERIEIMDFFQKTESKEAFFSFSQNDILFYFRPRIFQARILLLFLAIMEKYLL